MKFFPEVMDSTISAINFVVVTRMKRLLNKYLGRICKMIVLAVILCFSQGFVIAQNGYPFMLNISLREVTDPQVFSIGQDIQGNMLLVTRQGIILYDGEAMEMIQLPAFPFTVKTIPGDPLVYVGCNQQFGYMQLNKTGIYEYQRLSESNFQPGDVIRIVNNSSHVFFAADYSLARVSRSQKETEKKWNFLSDTLLTGLIDLNEKIYVQFNGSGITELNGDKFIHVKGSEVFLTGEIMFGLPFDKNRILIGTSNHEMVLFDGKNFTEYSTGYERYLRESLMIDAVLSGDDKIVFSTLIGGMVVVEKATGKGILILNNNTGLPDDEIYAIGSDIQGGVWVSHESGVTRIDFDFPAKIYNAYPGIQGQIPSIAFFNGKLYAAGNEGVFVLTEKRRYTEREVLVRVNSPAVNQTVQGGSITAAADEPVTRRDQRRLEREMRRNRQDTDSAHRERSGFLSRLMNVFRADRPEDTSIETEEQEQRAEYIRRRISMLHSVSHEFEKVRGINEKCKQLLLTKSGLIAVSNTAAYVIEDERARLIKRDNFIRFAAVSLNPESFYLVGGRGIYHMVKTGNRWVEQSVLPGYEQNIYSLVETSPGSIWLGSDNLIQRVQLNRNKPPQVIFIPVERNYFERVNLKSVNDTLFVFLSTGVYYLQESYLVPYSSQETGLVPSKRLLSGFRELFWLKTDEGWVSVAGEPYNPMLNEYLGVFKNLLHLFYDDSGDLWVLDEGNLIYRIVSPGYEMDKQEFNVYIRKISNQQGIRFPIDGLILNYDNNSLEFHVSSPGFLRESSMQYQYILDGHMRNWSKWSGSQVIEFPLLPPGKYMLRVRAKNVLGQISREQSVGFEIKPPFTQTIWFYAIAAVIVILVFLVILKMRELRLQRDKRELEYKVRKRTREIERQKNEIEQQADKIKLQHDQIFQQNKEITDSIFYAKRIQSAVMPAKSDFDKIFPENFLFFQPRDIVSGDFYWFKSSGKKAIVVAADCTGHGVPGAFMSMLGITLLNDLTVIMDWETASPILDELRFKVKETLSQKGIAGEAADGMDISLCLFDFEKKTVDYAGAFSPVYIFRNGNLIEYKGDRMPIGIHFREQKRFTNHKIDLQEGDIFYLFSDGYYSQLGGKDEKRFLSRNFKSLLQEIHSSPMKDQRVLLEKKLDEWMGANSQMDDILVMGFRYK